MNEENNKAIISEHYRSMAKKSHETIKNKYGLDFYKNIRLGTKKGKKGKKQKPI